MSKEEKKNVGYGTWVNVDFKRSILSVSCSNRIDMGWRNGRGMLFCFQYHEPSDFGLHTTKGGGKQPQDRCRDWGKGDVLGKGEGDLKGEKQVMV